MKILHLFQWKLTDIMVHLEKIKEQGFDAIQIGPIQPTKDKGMAWWLLYQPTGLTIGNYQIGTHGELIALCEKCNKLGIKVIVDVVLRHVAGDEHDPLKPHKFVDKELLPFIRVTKQCDNYDDRWKCTHMATGMPVLDYDNPEYQHMIVNFLDALLACGVHGFRLDQLKHYALPEEGSNIMHLLSQYVFYGECIYCRQDILDKYTKYMKVLTEGRPSNPEMLIAKFETHDDFLEFKTTIGMNDNMRLTEWDVLVNKCGYDALFYSRPFDKLWEHPLMKDINEGRSICDI